MAIVHSPVQTARFGVVCAALDTLDPTSLDLDACNRIAREQQVKLLTARIDVNELSFVRQLEADGFGLMDTLVYYGRSLRALPPRPTEVTDIKIREGRPEDAVDVKMIARKAFSGYLGHFHADPRLDDAAAKETYADWAAGIARQTDSAAPILLAVHGCDVAGFLAFRQGRPGETEITLNAIAPHFRRKGIYATLLSECLIRSQELGARHICVSTQINNYSVQRV